MRISALSLGAALAVATAASLIAPPVALAQRGSHRSDRRSSISPAPVTASDQSPLSASGDYSLAVVSALLPVETPGSTSDVVTLVIENRGTAPAPISFVSVAPQTRLASARRSTIPALAPGERTTVELPVVSGPDGTACISITITPAPAQDPATAQFLASAIPNLNDQQPSTAPDLPYWPDLPLAPPALQLGGWHSAGYPGIFSEPGEFFYDVTGYYGVFGALVG